ncbi:MAG TPA: prepilin peptidase [bacterium]|nr:prepilin peptidase [bacterium]
MPHSDSLVSIPAFFILGSAFGSFLNVCILRIPAGRSIVHPPSHCPRCKRAIAWYDNIPVLSYLLLGGKCRHCGKGISWQYPAVELLTAFLFVSALWRFGNEPVRLAWMLALLLVSVLLSVIDLRTLTLPDRILLPFGALCLLLAPFNPAFEGTVGAQYRGSLWGFLVGGGVLWGLSVIGYLFFKRENLGGGDVKLMAVFGSVLGWERAIDGLFLGSLLSSLAVMILLSRGRLTLKSAFAFGPFLCAGTLAAAFWPQAGLLFWLGPG